MCFCGLTPCRPPKRAKPERLSNVNRKTAQMALWEQDGAQGYGDTGTWGYGDIGHGDMETWEYEDMGIWGHRDMRLRGCGYIGT